MPGNSTTRKSWRFFSPNKINEKIIHSTTLRSLIEMGALIVELVHLWKCKKARLHDDENLVKQSDFQLTQKLVKWQRLHLVMQ